MRKIIFANRKGGSGKTSLVVNLAYNLSKIKKVLVVDLDSQAHSSFHLEANIGEKDKSIYHLFKNQVKISQLIKKTDYKNLSIIPSSPKMAALNEIIGDNVSFLDQKLKSLNTQFDYILFDLPPSIEKIVLSGLIASNEVIIPLQTHFFAMHGIAQLIQMIYDINENWGTNLKITGIVPTLFDKRTKIYKNIIDEISNTFGHELILPGIPYDIKLAESPSFREPIALYDKNCRATKAFDLLTQKILSMG